MLGDDGRFGYQAQEPQFLDLHKRIHAERFGQSYTDPVANSFTMEQKNMIMYAATSSVPIAGVTSGMISSGMTFDCLPAATTIQGSSYQPSPLQQWILPRPERRSVVGYEVGTPVQIIHLTSPEAAKYNDMIGDIVATNRVENPDGTSNLLFDVRCPISPQDLQTPERFVRDQRFFNTKLSMIAHGAATHNCLKLFNRTPEDMLQSDNYVPPVMLITGLPSEKLEPLGAGPARPSGGMDALPMLVRPPIWGEPCPPVVVGPDGKPLPQGGPPAAGKEA